MSSKRKSVAIIGSSSGSSDSDLSDSEFQNLAKKRKKSPQQKKKVDKSNSESSSSSDEEGEIVNKGSSSPAAAATAEKSSDVEDGEVSESDSDVGEFDDGLDEELMGDEEDRKRLEMMNEKEREEEIFKRAEKREMLKKRYEIEKKLKLQKKSTKEEEKLVNKGLDTKERSRARKEAVESKKDKKSLALDVLKAKRKEKQEQQQKLEDQMQKEKGQGKDEKKKWKANDIYSSDSSDDEVERARSRSPEKKRSTSSSSSSSSSVSSRSRSPSPESFRKRETISSRDELEKIRISRTLLEKWCHLPFFEEVVTGCFIRIAIGNNAEGRSIYRAAQIVGVAEGPKVYPLGNTRTNKTLKLRHAQQEKPFRMEFASNSKFAESEFDKWKEDTMLAGIYLPTVKEVDDKNKQIEKARTKVLNEKDIMHMVKEKERFMVNPRNYAMFKSRLTKERDTASAEGNLDEADRLTKRLAEVEERAEDLDRKRSEKISSIALINDRNRKNNIMKAEVNIKEEMLKKKKEGEKSDPFTRRKTKPMLATSVIKKSQNKDGMGEVQSQPEDTSIKPETKAVQAAKDLAAKEEKKENEPSKDLFSAHDFDIEINLDTFTPNSAIKMNLTPVVNTKKEMGPKKSLNLTDYKKKRGLI